MDTLAVVEIVGRLGLEVTKWILDLIRSGDEDPEATIRLEIADRRADVAARRAANDEALKRKHGIGE